MGSLPLVTPGKPQIRYILWQKLVLGLEGHFTVIKIGITNLNLYSCESFYCVFFLLGFSHVVLCWIISNQVLVIYD